MPGLPLPYSFIFGARRPKYLRIIVWLAILSFSIYRMPEGGKGPRSAGAVQAGAATAAHYMTGIY
jgi:hypothetical protein